MTSTTRNPIAGAQSPSEAPVISAQPDSLKNQGTPLQQALSTNTKISTEKVLDKPYNTVSNSQLEKVDGYQDQG